MQHKVVLVNSVTRTNGPNNQDNNHKTTQPTAFRYRAKQPIIPNYETFPPKILGAGFKSPQIYDI